MNPRQTPDTITVPHCHPQQWQQQWQEKWERQQLEWQQQQWQLYQKQQVLASPPRAVAEFSPRPPPARQNPMMHGKEPATISNRRLLNFVRDRAPIKNAVEDRLYDAACTEYKDEQLKAIFFAMMNAPGHSYVLQMGPEKMKLLVDNYATQSASLRDLHNSIGETATSLHNEAVSLLGKADSKASQLQPGLKAVEHFRREYEIRSLQTLSHEKRTTSQDLFQEQKLLARDIIVLSIICNIIRYIQYNPFRLPYARMYDWYLPEFRAIVGVPDDATAQAMVSRDHLNASKSAKALGYKHSRLFKSTGLTEINACNQSKVPALCQTRQLFFLTSPEVAAAAAAPETNSSSADPRSSIHVRL